MSDQGIERGAAEEGADSPLTQTEIDASKQAPSQGSTGPGSESGAGPDLDEHDKADSASGTDV